MDTVRHHSSARPNCSILRVLSFTAQMFLTCSLPATQLSLENKAYDTNAGLGIGCFSEVQSFQSMDRKAKVNHLFWCIIFM